ncbi:MAG: hypothetical protein LBR66_02655 [Candidatus Symbiothrix sp.]|nr:hypothetical protein [Candidatus Symbiothrix sp.]
MTKRLSYVACIAMALAGFACETLVDDTGGYNANEDGSLSIAAQVVNDSIVADVESVSVPVNGERLVTVDYANAGFSVHLPATLDAEDLTAVNEETIAALLPTAGLEVLHLDKYALVSQVAADPSDAKIAVAADFWGEKEGVANGSFYFANIDRLALETANTSELTNLLKQAFVETVYIYADQDVTITGSNDVTSSIDIDFGGATGVIKSTIPCTAKIDLKLKKGWNHVSLQIAVDLNLTTFKVTGKISLTDAVPAGLLWRYYPYN